MTENEFWELTSHYGWGSATTDYKAIEKDLMRKLSPDQADDLDEAYRVLQCRLKKAIGTWEVREGKSIPAGGDSYDDLVAHIIGMGKAEYDATIESPERAYDRARNHDYRESFSYAIPCSYTYERLDAEKYVKWATRIARDYDLILAADADQVPWLPKITSSLRFVSGVMKSFSATRDAATIIANNEETRAAAEAVAQILGKLRVDFLDEDGTLNSAISSSQNKWAVWNFCSDVQEYLA